VLEKVWHAGLCLGTERWSGWFTAWRIVAATIATCMYVDTRKVAIINTPMELAINNEIDRFTLAIEAIDRIPKLQKIGSHAKEKYRDQQTDCRNYAYEHGIDKPEIVGWRWPY